MTPSKRFADVELSLIRQINALATPLCVNLGIGEPNVEPDENLRRLAVEVAANGSWHYTPNPGTLSLRKLIAGESGLEVCVTAGTEEALFAIFRRTSIRAMKCSSRIPVFSRTQRSRASRAPRRWPTISSLGTRASRPLSSLARTPHAGETPALPGIWPFRIALSKLRPFNAAMITRTSIVLVLFAAFLYGDFALFRRLFAAMAKIEEATPFFALGLLRNLLALVFLAAVVMLFSSAMTAVVVVCPPSMPRT